MVAQTAETYGVEHLGLGSDLCQDQPDSVVTWMRQGRWTKKRRFWRRQCDPSGIPGATTLVSKQR